MGHSVKRHLSLCLSLSLSHTDFEEASFHRRGDPRTIGNWSPQFNIPQGNESCQQFHVVNWDTDPSLGESSDETQLWWTSCLQPCGRLWSRRPSEANSRALTIGMLSYSLLQIELEGLIWYSAIYNTSLQDSIPEVIQGGWNRVITAGHGPQVFAVLLNCDS